MPCSFAKSKRMCKDGKARVVKRCPFTIKLNFECENQVQELKLGMDVGSKFVGLSVISAKKELLAIEVELDQKTKERLDERRMYRRGRRNKLQYRKCRFLNRKIEKSWLPPSIERKYQTHLKLIKEVQKFLPILEENITIEVGNFDIQKLINPEIEENEYQEGNLFSYNNTKAFILERENYKCQICGNSWKKNDKFVLHHKIQRKDGGTDRPENLALLHESCHNKFHKKNLKMKANKMYKEATFMNIIKNRFQKDLPKCSLTFGYITKIKRVELNLEKSHINDAFVISGGSFQERVKLFKITQKHRNNRAIQLNRKSFAPSIRKNRSKIQPLNLFWVKGKEYICKGMHNKGKSIVCVNILKEKFDFSTRLVEKIFNFGSLVWDFIKRKV